MQEEIEILEIGQSIKMNGNIPKIRQICTRLDNKYKVVKINDQTCLVVRVEPDTKGLKETTLTAIDNMKPFDEIVVRGNIAYIRTIVSAYNKEHSTFIKVSKRGLTAVLNEDILDRKSITEEEYSDIELDFENQLMLIKEKVVNVMEQELI